MTTQERAHVVKLLVTMSELYNRQITKDAFTLMADQLMDLDGHKVVEALLKYLQDPASKYFPMPGQIRAMVTPNLSGDQIALEASNKIVEAMVKFGWTNPEKARQFMGEIAWDVVVREGGWSTLCERTSSDELPILKAQWRELAKVVAIKQKQQESQPTALPDNQNPKSNQLENNVSTIKEVTKSGPITTNQDPTSPSSSTFSPLSTLVRVGGRNSRN